MRDDLKAFLNYYGSTADRLGAKKKAYNRGIRKDRNPVIRMFLQDLSDLNEGGKLLRGVLVALGYRIGGGGAEEYADDLALAYEIFQTAILVHDDVIDNAALRRGKITIHRRYGHRLEVRGIRMVSDMESPEHISASTAVCAGDVGLYLANLKIAESYADDPNLSRLISYFDRVFLDTIKGELLDIVLPYEMQDVSRTREEQMKLLETSIQDIYRLKTAGYSVVGPLHLGMMLAGAGEDEMRALDRAADDIGVAYQIMDDILGVYADTEALGKDAGSDIAEFKQTILYMYVRSYAPEYEEELLRYYGREVTEESLEAVRRIFDESGALEYARSAMKACFERAGRKIGRMKFLSAGDRAVLRGFIEWCSGRRK